VCSPQARLPLGIATRESHATLEAMNARFRRERESNPSRGRCPEIPGASVATFDLDHAKEDRQ
jgi:hypothetical protein